MASHRRADIQGLRAVAILLVVAYHAGIGVRGGFTGVDVFFVISGFVITGSLLRSDAGLGSFYARRVWRLLPALALMIVVVAAAGVLVTSPHTQGLQSRTGIFASFFAANAYLYRFHLGYFAPTPESNPFLHTWTLSVEEQFYLLFPVVLALASRRNLAIAATAAITVCSFALSAALAAGAGGAVLRNPHVFAFYGSPSRAWEFGAGALLALTGFRMPRGGTAGIAAIVVGAFVLRGTGSFPGALAAVPVLGTCALVAAPARWLGWRPATWIGDRSYSWYLWHWPVIVGATAVLPGRGWVPPLAAAASIVPAAAAYSWVEEPLRLRGRRRVRGAPVAAAACIAAAVAACLVLPYSRSAFTHSAHMGEWTASQRVALDVSRCEALCVWHVPRERGIVALVGDSNAAALAGAVRAAAARDHLGFAVTTRSTCVFADVASSIGGESSGCERYVRAAVAALEPVRPALVVVADRLDVWLDDDTRTFAGTHDHSAKARVVQATLARTLRRLGSSAGVLVLHPVPAVPRDGPAGCAVLLIVTGHCSESEPRAAAEATIAESVRIENAAARAAHVSTLSLLDAVCSDRCTTTRDRRYTYRDARHLSPYGAALLTPLLARAFER